MRYSDKELEIIKSTFRDNEDLLLAIRKSFLQLSLDPIDVSMLNDLKDKRESLKVIRKSFLPTIEGDAPLHQVIDLWMTVEFKDKTPDMVLLVVKARELLIEYIDQQLRILEGEIKSPKILFNSLVKAPETGEEAYINLTVRNTAISHCEMQLNQFLILAGEKDETVEEMKDRLLKDSSK